MRRLKKVNFFEKKIIMTWLSTIGIVSAFVTIWSIFNSIEDEKKFFYYKLFIGLSILYYIGIWIYANIILKRELTINGSKIVVKIGDIFKEEGLRTIAFNEYFDTIVDNKIISEKTLNGKFIKEGYFDPKNNGITAVDLNDILQSNEEIKSYKKGFNEKRKNGNKQKYVLGTSIVYENYLITAMTKFDNNDRANLTQKDFINFLINFWDQVDIHYNGIDIVIPLLGSGITRFNEKIDISDQELLNLIIWTFKISRIKLKSDAKLVIVIHEYKKDYINFYDLHKLEKI